MGLITKWARSERSKLSYKSSLKTIMKSFNGSEFIRFIEIETLEQLEAHGVSGGIVTATYKVITITIPYAKYSEEYMTRLRTLLSSILYGDFMVYALRIGKPSRKRASR